MSQRPDFASWQQETLARFAAEVYDENTQLRADLRVAIDAYRSLLRERSGNEGSGSKGEGQEAS